MYNRLGVKHYCIQFEVVCEALKVLMYNKYK